METISITFDNNVVTITDGRHTSVSSFNEITYEPRQALIALAEFFGYDPAGVLCFDEDCDADEASVDDDEYDTDDEYDDDNDFLSEIAIEAADEETVNIWLDALLEATDKSDVNDLTAEEIRKEIDEVKGTISNEAITLGLPGSFAEENIRTLKAYLKVLEEMLNDKEEF